MGFSVSLALKPGLEQSLTLLLLITVLITFSQFFVSDYIKFLKNKEDIKLAQRIIGQAALGTGFLLAIVSLMIWLQIVHPFPMS